MTQIPEFLKKMLSISGLSAYETPISELISETWRPLVHELSTSKLGSLHGLRRGNGPDPRPRILMAAHMDAIGLMVTGISGDLLRFTEIGGVDPRILPGMQVIVHGRRDIPGVIAAPPDRLLPPELRSKPVEMGRLFVDTGYLADELTKIVRVGDLVSFGTSPQDLSGEVICGHSLDNRASVAAVTQCLDELQHMTHSWDVWAVATTQEEETLGGAFTSPFDIQPDLVVAIDVTFAKGPGVSDWRGFSLGKGPTLAYGPNIHPAMYKRFNELAEKLDVPHACELTPRHSGTDGYGMQVVAEGIPSMVIGIPLRYMHTPVEMVSYKDIQRTGHLLAEFIARLEPEFLNNIRWDE